MDFNQALTRTNVYANNLFNRTINEWNRRTETVACTCSYVDTFKSRL